MPGPRALSPEDAVKTLRLPTFAVHRLRELHPVENEVAGSVAAADVDALLRDQPALDPAAVHFVVWQAHSLLIAAEDSLELLARAFDGDVLAFASSACARAAVEAAAWVWWSLDPTIGPRGRCSRCLTLQMHATHEMAKGLRAAGEEDQSERHLASVLDGAVPTWLTIERPRRAAPFVEGYPRPQMTEKLLPAMLGRVGGELTYRFLSAGAHASVTAVAGRMLNDRAPDVVEGRGGRGSSRSEIGFVTFAAVSTYLAALRRWDAYTLWGFDVESLGVLTQVDHVIDDVI